MAREVERGTVAREVERGTVATEVRRGTVARRKKCYGQAVLLTPDNRSARGKGAKKLVQSKNENQRLSGRSLSMRLKRTARLNTGGRALNEGKFYTPVLQIFGEVVCWQAGCGITGNALIAVATTCPDRLIAYRPSSVWLDAE